MMINLAAGLLSPSTIMGGGATVIFLLWIVVHYFQVRRAMSLATRDLADEIQGAVSQISATDGPAAFAQQEMELNEALQMLPHLAHSWSEFREGLFDRDSVVDGQPVRANSRHAAEFFQVDRLIGDGLTEEVAAAKAGRFVGLGILGTFVGLTIGIYFAFQAMGAASVEEVRAGLVDLLSGSAVAFITSIAGLTASMLLEAHQQRCYGRLGAVVNQLHLALDARVELTTVEQLADRQLVELRTQSVQMKELNTQLAVKIADALGPVFTESMRAVLAQTEGRIAKLDKLDKLDKLEELSRLQKLDQLDRLVRLDHLVKLSRLDLLDGLKVKEVQEGIAAIVAGIESLGGSVGDSIKGQAGEGLKELGGALTKLNDALGSIRLVLTGSGPGTDGESAASLNRSILEAGNTLKAKLEEGATAAGVRLSDALWTVVTQKIGPLIEIIEKAATTSKESADSFSTSTARFDGSTDTLLTSVDAMEGYVGPLGEVGEKLTRATSGLETTLAALLETSKVVERLNQQLQTSSEDIRLSVDELAIDLKATREAWETQAGRFEGSDEAMKVAFERFITGVSTYTEKVNEFVRGMDGELGKSVTALAGVASSLDDAADALATTFATRR